MNKIETFLASLQAERGSGVSGDIVGQARKIADKTGVFLKERGVTTGAMEAHGSHRIAASFGLEGAAELGATGIKQFVQDCGVPARHIDAACDEIAVLLARAAEAGGQKIAMIKGHFGRVDSNTATKCVAYESLLPDSLRGAYSAGIEHFGVDTDRLESDLVTAITVSIMKWHNTIMPRLLHTISSTNPLVRYIRYEHLVYDLANSETEMIPVLDLYADPSVVGNELKQIIPLATSADIDYNGFIPVNKNINLFQVSLDADKYGHGTVNRTDLIADAVLLESVLLKLNYDNGDAMVPVVVEDELIEITIPKSIARLHRASDNSSVVRTRAVSYTATLNKTTKNVNGTASGALVALFGAATDAVKLGLKLTPTIDIRTSIASAYGALIPTFTDVNGETLAPEAYDPTFLTIELVGVKLDARYSEENFRKSSIIVTQESRELLYEVPQGRFYGADRSHLEDANADSRTVQVTNLQRVAGIGQDYTGIKAILGFLDTVKDETAAFAIDPLNNPRPGLHYAAGGKVIPTVIYRDMDFTNIDQFDDSRRQAAIGGRIEGVLSGVICDLLTGSRLPQQMSGGKLTFRALTSQEIVSKIIGFGTKKADVEGGVEAAIELPDGTVIEFITTSFDLIGDDIIILPFLKESPDSDLNFAHNRSCGTLTCAFTATHPSTASAERIMASVREAPVPTDVVGAIVTVKGIENAVFG
jgi:hypothetical protein